MEGWVGGKGPVAGFGLGDLLEVLVLVCGCDL